MSSNGKLIGFDRPEMWNDRFELKAAEQHQFLSLKLRKEFPRHLKCFHVHCARWFLEFLIDGVQLTDLEKLRHAWSAILTNVGDLPQSARATLAAHFWLSSKNPTVCRTRTFDTISNAFTISRGAAPRPTLSFHFQSQFRMWQKQERKKVSSSDDWIALARILFTVGRVSRKRTVYFMEILINKHTQCVFHFDESNYYHLRIFLFNVWAPCFSASLSRCP